MNFSINRETLLQGLNDCSKALSNKPQMPSLTGIRFSVTKSHLTLITCNNEISIKVTINKDLVVIEEGEFLVSGRYLIDIIRSIPNKDVDFITYDNNNIKVISGKSDYTLNCFAIDTFPSIVFERQPTNLKINSVNLKQVIKKTYFAASSSESRFILMGVSFVIKNNSLEVIATDSFRLSRKVINFDYDLPNLDIIVPSKSFDELLKILDESEDQVEISCSSTTIIFKFRNILFQSRLINGVFPKLDNLFPSSFLTQIMFKKDELLKTIERVSILLEKDANSLLKMTATETGNVEFSGISNEVGVAKEEIIPVEVINKTRIEISASSRFLLDALKTFDDEVVSLNFTGEIKPFTITSKRDYNLVQLILPVRS